MRKVFALLLLAGVATPALAAADPGDRRGGSHSNQQSTSDNQDNRSDNNNRQRGDRGNRGGVNGGNGGNDTQQQDHPRAVMHVAPSNGGGGGGGGGGGYNGQAQPATHVESNNSGGNNGGEHRRFNGGRDRTGNEPGTMPPTRDGSDTVRNWHGPKIVEPPHATTEDRSTRPLREQHRPVPAVLRNRVPIVSNTPREGTQPPLRAESRARDRNHHWNTDWRNNRHYDWQDWRRRHRSHFHLGLYFDPFGWNYQPWQIGWRLWPNYYSSRYWINDPYDYRLPYAPPGYRWIRYYDDAILVDTFTGEAVDVIHNFFW